MNYWNKLFKFKNSGNENSVQKECGTCGHINPDYVKFCAGCGSELKDMLEHFDAFISYRRETGSDLASLLKVQLENIFHKRIFLDIKELQVGKFDEALLSRIEETTNFILILSKASMERCVDKSDWLKREIMHALLTKRNIIPVFTEGFEFPKPEVWALLLDKMKELRSFQAVLYSHLNQDSAIRQIASYMKTLVSQHHASFGKENEEAIQKKLNDRSGKLDSGNPTLTYSESKEINIIEYLESKSYELNTLKEKHNREEKELTLKFEVDSARFIKEKILLLNKQNVELRNEFLDMHFIFSDFTPKNIVEVFAICDFFLDISLYDYTKLSHKIWLRSNISCYDLLSREISLLQEKISKASIFTWTVLRNDHANYFNSQCTLPNRVSSVLDDESDSNSKGSFPADFFIEHQKKVRNIASRDDKLFGDNSIINKNTSDTTFIFHFHPIFLGYLNEIANLERVSADYSYANGFAEADADRARMEFYFLFCKFLLMYSYALIKDNERNFCQEFIDIELKYISCHRSLL